MSKFAVGDRVRLTGKFLRSTGQIAGGEGQSVWTVTGFSGASRVVTDQPLSAASLESYTAAEIEQDPTLRFRRIAVANLQKVR